MKNFNAAVSFSGGKDSMLSLYRAVKEGYEIKALICTFEKNNVSCFHEIPAEILQEVAESLNVPIIKVEIDQNTIYEEEFEKALHKAGNLGVETCIFGDIDIESHKQWGMDRCSNSNMKALFPLWQEDREEIVNEFINHGFKAVIKKVNLNNLSEKFLGQTLTKELIEEIKSTGSDPCGENGEYHTLVYDGPLFSKKINFKVKSNRLENNYGYLNLKHTCN